MNGRAYYNEHDPYAAQWLRNLIAAGLIANGDVDERDIREVRASDLTGYTRCHFFAGIGGWDYALQLAGWPEESPVWTGSCPCQPFSSAGQRKGHDDERHLWPAFHALITECRPAVCFGEQVASALGREWLAGVRADLEALGYGVGAADLCAASVGAPHIRQRLFWLAHPERTGVSHAGCGEARGTARAMQGAEEERQRLRSDARQSGDPPGLGDANSGHGHWWSGPVQVGWNGIEGEIERGGRKHRAQWRVGPGIRIVADGIPNRVGALCGAGNAIVPQVAAEFISAFIEARSQMKEAV